MTTSVSAPAHSRQEQARERLRVIATARLVVDTVTRIGGGDPIAVDLAPVHDAAGDLYLPGASLAGAARAYLAAADRALIPVLFGSEQDNGRPSRLIIDDAYPLAGPRLTVRDGVRIDAETGTAAEGAKYDLEVIEPGAAFDLRLELVLTETEMAQETALITLFDQLLAGLAGGAVPVGARTRRGYGRVRAENWQVQRYRFDDSPAGQRDRLAWLAREQGGAAAGHFPPQAAAGVRAGQPPPPPVPAAPGVALLTLDAELDSALLIRSVPAASKEPDAVMLRAGGAPVVPGSSAAGVIAHRAAAIVRTLAEDAGISQTDAGALAMHCIESIFGYVDATGTGGRAPRRASRLSVNEGTVHDTAAAIQSRHRGDRFTGGVQNGGLFSEAPVWPRRGPGVPPARYRLALRLDGAQPHELDLLLMVLRDLWHGDLTLGGTEGIGRGMLKGQQAELTAAGVTWNWRRDEQAVNGVAEQPGSEPLAAMVTTYEGQLDAWVRTGGQHG